MRRTCLNWPMSRISRIWLGCGECERIKQHRASGNRRDCRSAERWTASAAMHRESSRTHATSTLATGECLLWSRTQQRAVSSFSSTTDAKTVDISCDTTAIHAYCLSSGKPDVFQALEIINFCPFASDAENDDNNMPQISFSFKNSNRFRGEGWLAGSDLGYLAWVIEQLRNNCRHCARGEISVL